MNFLLKFIIQLDWFIEVYISLDLSVRYQDQRLDLPF